MGDQLYPDDPVVSEGPLRDETQRLGREATAPHLGIEPVERLGPPGVGVELHADLADAPV